MKLPSNWKRYTLILAKFTSGQTLLQILSMFCGFLVVNQFSKTELAHFTVALTCLTGAFVLADSSILGSVSGFGGKVFQDRTGFSEVVNSALSLRRRVAAIVNGPLLIIMYYLLYKQHAPVWESIVLSLSVAAALQIQLNSDIFRVALRIQSAYERVQKADLVLGVTRCALTALACFVYKSAVAILGITVLVNILEFILLKRIVSDYVDSSVPATKDYQDRIWTLFLKQFPVSFFYVVQGSLIVFIISWMGKSNTLANVAAIGKFSTIYEVYKAVFASIFLPRFVTSQNKSHMKKMYAQILAVYTVAAIIPVIGVMIFSKQALMILGHQYAGLNTEIVIMLVAAAISSVGSVMSNINQSKAWFDYNWLYIPMVIVWAIVLAMCLDLSTTVGAAIFSALSVLPVILSNIIRTFFGFRRTEPAPVSVPASEEKAIAS